MTAVLEVEQLGRRFGGLAAVSDVSFSLEEATVLGVIGPNGAGKSTLINLITGHLKPSTGRVGCRTSPSVFGSTCPSLPVDTFRGSLQ